MAEVRTALVRAGVGETHLLLVVSRTFFGCRVSQFPQRSGHFPREERVRRPREWVSQQLPRT